MIKKILLGFLILFAALFIAYKMMDMSDAIQAGPPEGYSPYEGTYAK